MRPLPKYFGNAKGQESLTTDSDSDMEEDVSNNVIDRTNSVENVVPDSAVSETVPDLEYNHVIVAELEGPALESCGFPLQE